MEANRAGRPIPVSKVRPDLGMMLRLVRECDDRGRVFHAALDIEVPQSLRRGPSLA